MSVVQYAFNNIKLETVSINGKYWTRAKEVCRALEYQASRARDILKNHVSVENKHHKYELVMRAVMARPLNWPSDSQKFDLYLNEQGMYELVFGSQQPKAKTFRKYCCNTMFPNIRRILVDKLQQDLQQKDSTLALLNDDLTDCEMQIVIL